MIFKEGDEWHWITNNGDEVVLGGEDCLEVFNAIGRVFPDARATLLRPVDGEWQKTGSVPPDAESIRARIISESPMHAAKKALSVRLAGDGTTQERHQKSGKQ